MKREIDTIAKARPFALFEMELVGGRVLRVKHPEFVYVPPGRGIHVVYTHEDGTSEFVNALLIVGARAIRPPARRKAG